MPSVMARACRTNQRRESMGIGASIFLVALGAVLAFALNESSIGPLEVQTVGYILMIAGIVGLALTLLVFGPRHARRDDVVEERVVRDRQVY